MRSLDRDLWFVRRRFPPRRTGRQVAKTQQVPVVVALVAVVPTLKTLELVVAQIVTVVVVLALTVLELVVV